MVEEATTAGNWEWVIELEERGRSLDNRNDNLWEKQSIYRVPTSIKNLNRKVYEPRLVSLGPYHHGTPELKAMEEHKERALHNFCKKTKKRLSVFVEALKGIVEDLMGSYDMLEEEWRDTSRFLQLMIVDGCFLFEILDGRIADHEKNDPIFSSQGILNNKDVMMQDMLKIENQVPLIVLTTLAATAWGKTVDEVRLSLKP
ncbi:UPF0481 protein At3g47200-like [Tasmannia lanceolata]|uniref:UPF0481 protein At3g47200-like n=1 Tax=Tasmannia lanceolata TaxID=3420 RepID=UPI0040644611